MQPWYWRSLPLKERTGSDIFAHLFQPQLSAARLQPFAVLLESPYPLTSDQPHLSRFSICAGAPRLVNGQPQVWTPPLGGILPCLKQRLQHAQSSRLDSQVPETLPFTGGWLGWLGYDLAWEIERLPQLKADVLPFPVACWYEPDCFVVLDHKEQQLWLAATEPTQLDDLTTRLTDPLPVLVPPAGNPAVTAPDFYRSRSDYIQAVQQSKRYIRAGDVFQVNLSLRFGVSTSADSWSLYRDLQQINPSPFASYWQTPWGAVISCAPERLVALQDKQAQTRPIAGTRPRGCTPEQDQQLAIELHTNVKERAEHIMLVDLERNDLGRVCTWGSVCVDELLTIERYSHVMHLVSNITGTLRPEYDGVDLIRAVFPGGTITGCPKIRCLEIIEELEPQRRNLFYGSCGYLDHRGNLDLNILIRTLLYQPAAPTQPTITPLLHTVWGQVGAGIVSDSDPDREWEESLHKAQAQLAALGLIASNPFAR